MTRFIKLDRTTFFLKSGSATLRVDRILLYQIFQFCTRVKALPPHSEKRGIKILSETILGTPGLPLMMFEAFSGSDDEIMQIIITEPYHIFYIDAEIYKKIQKEILV